MGSFTIILREKITSIDRLKRNFLKRGFSSVKEIQTEKYTLLYTPKMGGKEQHYSDEKGSHLIVVGTVWYQNLPMEQSSDQLLSDYFNGRIRIKEFSGTFTLVFTGVNGIKIYHDPYAVNRFFVDRKEGIISSSWLFLMWNRPTKNRELNKEAVVENLLMGFNIGVKTWIKDIERVKHQSQLPADILYNRCQADGHGPIFVNKKEAIEQVSEKFSNGLNSNLAGFNKIVLGLSSGYDSRLVTASLNKENLEKLHLFTFHKPGDRDPVIAAEIAGILEKKLTVQQTAGKSDAHELPDIYNRAFLFFDGQCAEMMQYSKEDYTKEFRDNVFSKDDLHLSGVGGEMFRNHIHDHRFLIGFKHWINHYFNGGGLPENLPAYQPVFETIENEIKTILNIDRRAISYNERRRFYAEVMLSDWHGLRNSVENQYVNYYSAFTHSDLIKLSTFIAPYLGVDGCFEAHMIQLLSPELAKLNSEYGHSFVRIPLRKLFTSYLKTYSKTVWLGKLRVKFRTKKTPPTLNDFERSLVENFKLIMDLPQREINRLLSSKKEQTLATAYILSQMEIS